jgi:hypothetical protein
MKMKIRGKSRRPLAVIPVTKRNEKTGRLSWCTEEGLRAVSQIKGKLAKATRLFVDNDKCFGVRFESGCAAMGVVVEKIPKRSPDLMPLDFAIFGAVKRSEAFRKLMVTPLDRGGFVEEVTRVFKNYTNGGRIGLGYRDRCQRIIDARGHFAGDML